MGFFMTIVSRVKRAMETSHATEPCAVARSKTAPVVNKTKTSICPLNLCFFSAALFAH